MRSSCSPPPAWRAGSPGGRAGRSCSATCRAASSPPSPCASPSTTAADAMRLRPEQELVRDTLRTFARQELAPHAARWDREHTFPREALRGLGELGALGVVVPETYGGAGLDYVTLALVLEEIAAGDGATSTIVSVQ